VDADAVNAGEELGIGQSRTSVNGKYTVTFQNDGNLVMYEQSGSPVWASNTAGSGATRAVMQEDGNFVVYKQDGSPAWATNTFAKGGRLIVGNSRALVVVADGNVVWSSGTEQ
jgi:hypothetical protein